MHLSGQLRLADSEVEPRLPHNVAQLVEPGAFAARERWSANDLVTGAGALPEYDRYVVMTMPRNTRTKPPGRPTPGGWQ